MHDDLGLPWLIGLTGELRLELDDPPEFRGRSQDLRRVPQLLGALHHAVDPAVQLAGLLEGREVVTLDRLDLRASLVGAGRHAQPAIRRERPVVPQRVVVAHVPVDLVVMEPVRPRRLSKRPLPGDDLLLDQLTLLVAAEGAQPSHLKFILHPNYAVRVSNVAMTDRADHPNSRTSWGQSLRHLTRRFDNFTSIRLPLDLLPSRDGLWSIVVEQSQSLRQRKVRFVPIDGWRRKGDDHESSRSDGQPQYADSTSLVAPRSRDHCGGRRREPRLHRLPINS